MGSAGGGGAGGGPGGGGSGSCTNAVAALISVALAVFIALVSAVFAAAASFATGTLRGEIITNVITAITDEIDKWWSLVRPTVSTAVLQYEKQFNIQSSSQAIQTYINGPLNQASTCTGLQKAMSGIQGILGQISSAASSIWAKLGSQYCFGQVVPQDSLISPFCCTSNTNFGNFEEAGTSKGAEIAKLNKWISWFNAVKGRVNGEISAKQSADIAALNGVRSGATKGCSFTINVPRVQDVLNKPPIRDCFGFLAGYLAQLQAKVTEGLNKIKTKDYGAVIKNKVDSDGSLTSFRGNYNTGVSAWNFVVSTCQNIINALPAGCRAPAQIALDNGKAGVQAAAAANGLSVTNYSTNAAMWSAVCKKITGSSNAFPTKVNELVCWVAPFSPSASEMMTAAINAITEMPGLFAAKDQLYNSVLDLMIGACQGLIAAISALQDQCNITFSGSCNRGGGWQKTNPCNRTTGCSFTLTNPTDYNLNCSCTGGCDDSCTVTGCGVARNSCYAGGASVSCSWKKKQSKQVIVYDVYGGLSGGHLTCVCTKAVA